MNADMNAAVRGVCGAAAVALAVTGTVLLTTDPPPSTADSTRHAVGTALPVAQCARHADWTAPSTAGCARHADATAPTTGVSGTFRDDESSAVGVSGTSRGEGTPRGAGQAVAQTDAPDAWAVARPAEEEAAAFVEAYPAAAGVDAAEAAALADEGGDAWLADLADAGWADTEVVAAVVTSRTTEPPAATVALLWAGTHPVLGPADRRVASADLSPGAGGWTVTALRGGPPDG